jgi:hypothetical protein
MMLPESFHGLIVDADDEFNRQSESRCPHVLLDGSSDEAAYERVDRHLAKNIDHVLAAVFGAENVDILYHQIYDWWPTKTRFIELDQSCLSWPFIESVQSILSGEHSDWVVNVQVYKPLSEVGSPHIGSVNVYRNFVLMQRKVVPSA